MCIAIGKSFTSEENFVRNFNSVITAYSYNGYTAVTLRSGNCRNSSFHFIKSFLTNKEVYYIRPLCSFIFSKNS